MAAHDRQHRRLKSGDGTKLPIRDVGNPVATGGIADKAQKAQFGSD
jgi:hypothetical protein